MFRPAINKKTGEVELLNLNNGTDLTDKELVRIAKEANEGNISLDGGEIKTKVKGGTRELAQKLSEQEEELKINEALSKEAESK